jgi:hypothetical protein
MRTMGVPFATGQPIKSAPANGACKLFADCARKTNSQLLAQGALHALEGSHGDRLSSESCRERLELQINRRAAGSVRKWRMALPHSFQGSNGGKPYCFG